jgi:hypothetical protein
MDNGSIISFVIVSDSVLEDFHCQEISGASSRPSPITAIVVAVIEIHSQALYDVPLR